MEWAQSVACADLQDGDVVATHAIAGGGPEIRVRALRPTLHPEIADVVEAHNREALRRFNVEVPTKAPLREMGSTWLLVAEAVGDATCYMAGIRLEFCEATHVLPLEQTLAPFGQETLALLRSRFVGRMGEFAGLWVRDDFCKLGLPDALVSAGITAARRARLTRLFSLLPRHTQGIFAAEGFQPIRELGDDGEFPYPNQRYRSRVMELDLAPAQPLSATSGAKQCVHRTELPGVANGFGVTHEAAQAFEETRR